MSKKLLSLALALVMCLGLTVPAFAAGEPGSTTIQDDGGFSYTLSKPLVGTRVDDQQGVTYYQIPEGTIISPVVPEGTVKEDVEEEGYYTGGRLVYKLPNGGGVAAYVVGTVFDSIYGGYDAQWFGDLEGMSTLDFLDDAKATPTQPLRATPPFEGDRGYCLTDEARSFAAADPLTDKIGQNVADFLAADMKRGIIPSTFLPLQSGVGNIANAVLGALGRDKTIPAFEMYTEVIQNSVIGLIREGRIKFGSACSLTVTNDCLEGIYNDMDFFRDKLVLRPSEISNNPEVVRRLGIISINTAIEVDLYGNVNSTHIGGTKMMNGIGGSGDFTRNAYISIFTCPSVAKEGKISAIVPMVSHLDHSEHSVNIIITEQGVADLRGKSPKERAEAIIENCAHPDYKQLLWDYLKLAGGKAQTPHAIQAALGMHAELAKSGDMKNTNWAEYAR